MRPGGGMVLALAAPGLALAVWLAGLVALIRAATGADGVAISSYAAGPVAAIAFGWWVAGLIAGAYAVRGLWRRHVLAPARLLNAARIVATDKDAVRGFQDGAEAALQAALPADAAPMLRGLASEFAAMSAARARLSADMAQLVDNASRNVAEQRDQLAALMAELDHAVVVCNLDGRILLYNERARLLARRLAPVWTAQVAQAGPGGGDRTGEAAPAFDSIPRPAGQPVAGQAASSVPNTGSGVGLGRSIYGILDRAAVAHAIETVASRLARGVGAEGAAAQFVTTAESGQLLQVSLAPVRPDAGASSADQSEPAVDPAAQMTGFVLMLDDITRDQQAQSTRDAALREMTETARASVANMQAALEMLDFPDLSPPERDRFMGVIRDEVAAMGARLGSLAPAPAPARWPLQDMLGGDLLTAALRRLGATTGAPVASFPVESDLWLRLDSFGLIQALDFLAARLGALQPDPDLWLRLARAGGRAHLDLGWRARPGTSSAPAAMLAQLPSEPMPDGLSVRELMDRHGGEIWLERNRDGAGAADDSGAFFRLLLPLAAVEAEGPAAITGARPEFYDFDLFAAAQSSAADDQPLAALSFTVFDCETTGLDPAGGDEIIQIGAVRILNSRILRAETIDQLVDPQRSIPEAGIPIHHIHPHMVRGQPTIAQALPVFHRFAEGSVLVGHNVAFDMRFLKLKESSTRCVFDHPVLDTLLLSSVVHPAEDSHSLEAIAARLGITIGGRHTALGDALATAEVFARLIPLLARQGVVTLGQARAAAGRSQFARLKY